MPEAISPLVTSPDGSKRFRISDHLASLRVEIGPSGTTAYGNDPWGNPILVPAGEQSRTTHNNNEQDRESGDFSSGVRQSDPRTGRFNSVDVLAEKQPRQSPYSYCGNNPLRYTDPTGMQQRTVIVPFNDGGMGVPTGGVSPVETYMAYHPEIASQVAYEARWRSQQAQSAAEAGKEAAAAARQAAAAASEGSTAQMAAKGSTAANGTSTAVSTYRYTTNGEKFFHYGYAEHASKFEGGLRPGAFATSSGNLSGAEAKAGLALPHATAPDAAYIVTPADATLVRVNPVVEPQFGQPGGLTEFQFPLGTGPGTVIGPFSIPLP